MENISYETLKKIGYKGYLPPKDAPEKVLQFGEGNFLRAFVDRFFDMGNEATGWNGKVVMVQPISGACLCRRHQCPGRPVHRAGARQGERQHG